MNFFPSNLLATSPNDRSHMIKNASKVSLVIV